MDEVQVTVKALITLSKKDETSQEDRTLLIASAKLIADQASIILDLLHAIKPFALFESSGWHLDNFHGMKSPEHPVIQLRNGPSVTRRHFKDALKIYNKES